GAIYAYARLGGRWWLFAALFLAPDLSMLGYLFGRRVGAACYNAVHTYLTPFAIAALAAALHVHALYGVACILTAHIAFDRVQGYGLKYATAFAHTHLGLRGSARAPSKAVEPR